MATSNSQTEQGLHSVMHIHVWIWLSILLMTFNIVLSFCIYNGQNKKKFKKQPWPMVTEMQIFGISE